MKKQNTIDQITVEQLEEITGDVLFGGKPKIKKKGNVPTKKEASRKFRLVKRISNE